MDAKVFKKNDDIYIVCYENIQINEGEDMHILFTKTGGIQMLHDDNAQLETLGKVDIERASHVEWDNDKQKWYVQSAKTLEIFDYFDDREAALAWEREHYSPKGEGWAELTGTNN